MLEKFIDWAGDHVWLTVAIIIALKLAILIGAFGLGYYKGSESARMIEKLDMDFAKQVYECETVEEKDFLLETVYGFGK